MASSYTMSNLGSISIPMAMLTLLLWLRNWAQVFGQWLMASSGIQYKTHALSVTLTPAWTSGSRSSISDKNLYPSWPRLAYIFLCMLKRNESLHGPATAHETKWILKCGRERVTLSSEENVAKHERQRLRCMLLRQQRNCIVEFQHLNLRGAQSLQKFAVNSRQAQEFWIENLEGTV